MSIDAVANDLRTDEHNDFVARERFVLMRENITEFRDLIEHRDAASVSLLALADQAGQQNVLTACYSNRAFDLALLNRRRQRRPGIRDIADFLLNLEAHISVGMDLRY